jgi:hypothetical protein
MRTIDGDEPLYSPEYHELRERFHDVDNDESSEEKQPDYRAFIDLDRERFDRQGRAAMFGGWLLHERRRSKIGPKKLADMTGVHVDFWHEMEKGLRLPDPQLCKRIAEALHIHEGAVLAEAGLIRDYAPDRELMHLLGFLLLKVEENQKSVFRTAVWARASEIADMLAKGEDPLL